MNYSFNKMFTLAEVAKRAGLPIERLRYVIDSDILPGRRHRKPGGDASNPGRGIPRLFTPDEAFALVVVVLMLQGGIRRRAVQACLDLLGDYLVPNSKRLRDTMWIQVIYNETVVALEIGDGLNIRLDVKEGAGRRTAICPAPGFSPRRGPRSRIMTRF